VPTALPFISRPLQDERQHARGDLIVGDVGGRAAGDGYGRVESTVGEVAPGEAAACIMEKVPQRSAVAGKPLNSENLGAVAFGASIWFDNL
jgi:hypothetical protein